MYENEININEINKQFEELRNEIKLLKEEDEKNKKTIKKNVENIGNLNVQLIELKRKIDELEKREFLVDHVAEKEDDIQKNKINIDENYIDKVNDKNKKEKKGLFGFLNKKNNSSNKNIHKEKNVNEEVKIRTLIENFENKLVDIIFNEDNKNKINNLNDFKKICTVLLIKDKNPGELFVYFLEKNKYNTFNDIDNEKKSITIKKDEIFTALADIHNVFLIKDIDKHKINEFIKELREKIGITEEDMKDEEIRKEIKNNKYNIKNTINSILTKNKSLYNDK